MFSGRSLWRTSVVKEESRRDGDENENEKVFTSCNTAFGGGHNTSLLVKNYNSWELLKPRGYHKYIFEQ